MYGNDSSGGGNALVGTGAAIFYLIVYIVYAAALWRVFTKAGRPGWLAIIPIVNLVVLFRITGHSGWLVVLYLIPLVNIVVHAFLSLWTARSYGRGGGFAVGLFFLQFVFVLILGFGSSRYVGPQGPAGRPALGYA